MLQQGLNALTVRHVLGLLYMICDRAVGEGFLRHSPKTGVSRPKAEHMKKGRALKPEEINSIPDQCNPETRLRVLMAILTGMRRGDQFVAVSCKLPANCLQNGRF